jgi:ribosomal-protein-alanine N-acetyltransferase
LSLESGVWDRESPLEKVVLERIKIEPMKEEDLPEVMEIERNSFPIPWAENSFRYELNKNKEIAILKVAKLDKLLVGYVCYWLLFKEVHIMNLAVHNDFRRQGIGEALIRAALKEARGKGGLRATLEVRASNTPAIKLYEKLGFKVTAKRHNYYDIPREDALVMWRYDLREIE